MSDQDDLLLNNRFLVAIGPVLLSFAKVTNIQDSYPVTQIPEGGKMAPFVIPEVKKTPETLILERGQRKTFSAMAIDEVLTTGTPLVAVTIMIADQKGRYKKAYFFEQGIITKWELSGLDGMGQEVLIKKMEITHSGLTQIPVPF